MNILALVAQVGLPFAFKMLEKFASEAPDGPEKTNAQEWLALLGTHPSLSKSYDELMATRPTSLGTAPVAVIEN